MSELTGTADGGDTLIIGLDPGKTCGVAQLTLLVDGRRLFDSDDVPACDVADHLERRLESHRGRCVIAAERFTQGRQTGRRTRQNDALEIIGTAQVIAKRFGCRFIVQGVADAQRAGSPAVLRHLGMWVPGYDHRNKAAAQVAAVWLKMRPDEFERVTGVVVP